MPSNSERNAYTKTIEDIVAERQSTSADKEPVRIMLIGSGPGIHCVAKDLHQLGFADVGDWSKTQPYPNSGQSMSVLTKWRHE